MSRKRFYTKNSELGKLRWAELTMEEWVNENLFNFVECRDSNEVKKDIAYQIYCRCCHWEEETIITQFNDKVQIINTPTAPTNIGGTLMLNNEVIYPNFCTEFQKRL